MWLRAKWISLDYSQSSYWIFYICFQSCATKVISIFYAAVERAIQTYYSFTVKLMGKSVEIGYSI